MKTMRKAALLGALAMAVAAAACGGDAGGGGGDVGGEPGPRAGTEFDLIDPAVPTPTVTPAGPIVLKELSTPDGTTRISSGKCLGFTLEANEPDLYFSPTTKVTVGALGVVPTVLRDATHLRVGAPANANHCIWTPLFGTPGKWDVTVQEGDRTWVIEDAIEVLPTKVLDMGMVSVGEEYVWTMDRIADAEANRFEVPFDMDVYRADFWAGTASHVFAHMEFFPTGAPALVPVMEFRDADDPAELLGRGGIGLIFPMRGVNYIVVKDVLGQGGPGATYDISFATQTASGAPANDNCAGDVPALTPRTYHVNYDVLTNDFDPQGNSGCRDTLYKNAISAPGNDAIWRVTVPAGKQLRVSTYDDHINNVTYLLPISTLSTGCTPKPTNCVAAAGRFGGGNTDTLIYDNITSLDQEFLLVHDSATVMTSGVGSFLMDVEIFERY